MNEQKIVELADDAKTIVEYEAIILRFLQTGKVPSSIMRKFIYKSGRTQSAQGRETCP